MTALDPTQTALLLRRIEEGDSDARAELFEVLYSQLRVLARREIASGPGSPTLQATALVHEAWLRLAITPELRLENRKHFLNVAASVMRRVLIDHARKRRTTKRNPEGEREPLDLLVGALETESSVPLLELDQALVNLHARDAALAKIVELRYFCGLSEEEVGDVLGKSRRQVQHAWKLARAFLLRELERGAREPRDS